MNRSVSWKAFTDITTFSLRNEQNFLKILAKNQIFDETCNGVECWTNYICIISTLEKHDEPRMSSCFFSLSKTRDKHAEIIKAAFRMAWMKKKVHSLSRTSKVLCSIVCHSRGGWSCLQVESSGGSRSGGHWSLELKCRTVCREANWATSGKPGPLALWTDDPTGPGAEKHSENSHWEKISPCTTANSHGGRQPDKIMC